MKKHCQCKIKDKKNWVVIDYKCNYSYFSYPKGCKKYSDYSLLKCNSCKSLWRTKAKYVDEIYYKSRTQW